MVGNLPSLPPNVSNLLGQEFSILRSKWGPCFRAHREQLPEPLGELRGRRDLASGDRVGGGRGGGGCRPVSAGPRGWREPRRRGYYYFPPRLPCLLALRSGANAAAAFRVLAGPTRIRRQQQPGLGVCGRCQSRPSARGVDSERRGSRGASAAAAESPAVPLGTISPPVSSFFPSQHPCVWAPGSESQGLSCGLRCCRRPPNSSRPRWGPCVPPANPPWGAGQDVLPEEKKPRSEA